MYRYGRLKALTKRTPIQTRNTVDSRTSMSGSYGGWPLPVYAWWSQYTSQFQCESLATTILVWLVSEKQSSRLSTIVAFGREGLKCVSRFAFTFQKPKMRSSHNFAFRASQRHYTRPAWSIVSPRNDRQNYSRIEMKGRISWFVRSVKMVSACNKTLNIKTLSVNCDHRSKPMFRPTSCLVFRGCTRVWIIELLFMPRELRGAEIQSPYISIYAISRNILAHPRNPVRHPGD